MRLPTPPERYSAEFMRELARLIEDADAGNVKHEGKRVYAESNVTTSRTFDADTVLLAELADIVGTLIKDLREKKVIG